MSPAQGPSKRRASERVLHNIPLPDFHAVLQTNASAEALGLIIASKIFLVSGCMRVSDFLNGFLAGNYDLVFIEGLDFFLDVTHDAQFKPTFEPHTALLDHGLRILLQRGLASCQPADGAQLVSEVVGMLSVTDRNKAHALRGAVHRTIEFTGMQECFAAEFWAD